MCYHECEQLWKMCLHKIEKRKILTVTCTMCKKIIKSSFKTFGICFRFIKSVSSVPFHAYCVYFSTRTLLASAIWLCIYIYINEISMFTKLHVCISLDFLKSFCSSSGAYLELHFLCQIQKPVSCHFTDLNSPLHVM